MIKTGATQRDLMCSCHGNQLMAQVRGGVLVIISKHHGSDHVVRIPIDKLVEHRLESS